MKSFNNIMTAVSVVLLVLLLIAFYFIYHQGQEQRAFDECLMTSTWTIDKQELDRMYSDEKGHDLLVWEYTLKCDDDPSVTFTYRETKPSWYIVTSKLRFAIQILKSPEIPNPDNK